MVKMPELTFQANTDTIFYYDDINDAGEKKIFDAVSVERFDAIVLMSESFKQDEDMKKMVDILYTVLMRKARLLLMKYIEKIKL